MAFENPAVIKEYLKDHNFKQLFVSELGWDNIDRETVLEIDEKFYLVNTIAEKRGVAVFVCLPAEGENDIPLYKNRIKIDKELQKQTREHLTIFTDNNKNMQVWQWVQKTPGKPTAYREYKFNSNQSFDRLLPKLENVTFTLSDEEGMTLSKVLVRLKDEFDRDKVTKKFFDRFKKQRDAFERFLDGIPDEGYKRWYVSVMLNRLMFIYFMQKKGFLDNDINYLSTKLELYADRSYYKDFLCHLFFDGFATFEQNRSDEINEKLGKIPYLNGGIFMMHEIEEKYGKTITIHNDAFKKLFAFFDEYDWVLDDRPLREGNEINPDVLGYIFEKYINQKQMGAYYTKEDITGYISRNTVIPFIFDKAKEYCKIAFEGESAVFRILMEDPDRYIYDAVKHGTHLELPDYISAGINDVSQRTRWNETASEEYALPTEIWREVVERFTRYNDIKARITNGEIIDINDFITYNLDIEQFAQDVILNYDGSDLIWAMFKAIKEVTILDPAVGSGAFLFAALNILEPLYESCIERMENFISEYPADVTKYKLKDFQKVLDEDKKHPNRAYFILKSIILDNLYGVDIMEEAVEICKLRLFLKLVAQIDNVKNIEPLPDIDFNMKAGNSLVGFATIQDVEKIMQSKLSFDFVEDMKRKLDDLKAALKNFRLQQKELGGHIEQDAKTELRNRLRDIEDDLNIYLAEEYNIPISNKKEYDAWLKSHSPFHWFVEFYAIMEQGGFDVVIGNPPYVEYSKVKKDYTIIGYETESCGNLYAFIMERNEELLKKLGLTGMIIPHSAICTDRMKPILNSYLTNYSDVWFSSYGIRPDKLFNGVDQRLGIYVAKFGQSSSINVHTTKYNKWQKLFRESLLNNLNYVKIEDISSIYTLPKVNNHIALSIYKKIVNKNCLSEFLYKGNCSIFYHNSPRYWIRAMEEPPYFWSQKDGNKISSHVKEIKISDSMHKLIVISIINSSLFYLWFIFNSNCRDLTSREIEKFSIDLNNFDESIREKLSKLTNNLLSDYEKNSTRKSIKSKQTGEMIYDEFYPKLSKPIIDEIDRVLAEHYGFTDEELDFIINYDIKYRMGLGK